MIQKKPSRESFHKQATPSLRNMGNKLFDFHKARSSYAVQLVNKKLSIDAKQIFPVICFEINPELSPKAKKPNNFKTLEVATIDRWKERYNPSKSSKKIPNHLPLIGQLSKVKRNQLQRGNTELMQSRLSSIKQLDKAMVTKKITAQEKGFLERKIKRITYRSTVGSFREDYGLENGISGKPLIRARVKAKGSMDCLFQVNQGVERWDFLSDPEQPYIAVVGEN